MMHRRQEDGGGSKTVDEGVEVAPGSWGSSIIEAGEKYVRGTGRGEDGGAWRFQDHVGCACMG